MNKKLALACAAMFALSACCMGGCDPKEPKDETPVHTHTFESGWTTSETEHWHKATCEHKEETSERAEHDFGDSDVCKVCGYRKQGESPEPPDDGTFDLATFDKLPTIQLSTLYAVEEGASCKLKMRAPYTDQYEVSFSTKAVEHVEFYDGDGKLLYDTKETFTLDLEEGEIVYANIFPVKDAARITVTARDNKSPLPFEIAEAPDPASFDVNGDPNVDPLQPAEIKYTKRKDTLYVYCNAPEDLKSGPQVVNKCITRQDVSDQSVYFTFEQQSHGLKEAADKMGLNFANDGVYYGYRVTNTGTEDLFVTVRNLGWQLDGKGAFLGEREWIDFYNTRFELPDFSDLTERQLGTYTAYYNFDGNYIVHDFQPTTYRIPAGKYIYVMGGTTADAFGNFNVCKTANQLSTNSECGNGAVLFDVVGKAEGAWYVYNDISKVIPGGEGYDTHVGINDPAAYGVVHTGEDEGYVIDNQATWIFNDKTKAQKLPVTFTNYYSDDAPSNGTPNTPIPNTTAHTQNLTTWVTHLDVQQNHNAVGTDMTAFHTVNKNGERIVVGCNYYDTRGTFPNIGNWMKDYQDLFTFVNQGDQEREVTINIGCNGAVVVLMRDMQGRRIENSWTYSMVRNTKDQYGDGFSKPFAYKIKIPAHSVAQYVVEYNLMANSTGNVTHSVDLK